MRSRLWQLIEHDAKKMNPCHSLSKYSCSVWHSSCSREVAKASWTEPLNGQLV